MGEIGLVPILLKILMNEKQSPPPNFYIEKPIVVEMTAGILLSLSTKSINKARIIRVKPLHSVKGQILASLRTLNNLQTIFRKKRKEKEKVLQKKTVIILKSC